MEPLSLIVSALAAGAAAGLQPTAEKAVKDAYAAVKNLIKAKYPAVDIETIEEEPGLEAKRAHLTKDFERAGAVGDRELLERAGALAELVAQYDRGAAAAVGVELDRVRAAFLEIGQVDASGSGVKITESDFTGGIQIGEVSAGRRKTPSDPS